MQRCGDFRNGPAESPTEALTSRVGDSSPKNLDPVAAPQPGPDAPRPSQEEGGVEEGGEDADHAALAHAAETVIPRHGQRRETEAGAKPSISQGAAHAAGAVPAFPIMAAGRRSCGW